MDYRTYRIDFYRTVTVGDDGNTIRDLLQDAISNHHGLAPPAEVQNQAHFIGGLTNSRGLYRGEFARLRRDDLPRIGDEYGHEQDLTLAENEGLVEKNHFIFDPSRQLLVWQVNKNGSHISRMETYFRTVLPEQTGIYPIVEGDALERLMQGNLMLSKIDVSFALPTNPEQFPTSATSGYFLNLINGIGAESITVRAAANAPGRGTGRALRNRVKGALREISQMPGARVVRARGGGVDEAIDLIAQRLTTEITVSMSGRYPNRQKIFSRMTEAISAAEDDLKDFFGEEDNRID